MVRKITIVLLSVIILECNGHLPILGDILSKTRERVHSTVDGVAGAVLGGISHGLNLNFGGHFGFNRHHQKAPPKQPDETIVVIIEEPSENVDKQNNNNYKPTHHDYRPNHNHFQDNRPPADPNPGYNGQTQGPYYNNDRENHQNQFNTQNNNYNSNEGPHEWNNGNQNNGYDTGNQVNYNKPPKDNHQGNDDYNHKSPNENTNQFNEGSFTEIFTTSKTTVQIPSSTEKSSDDIPLFVPLDPNQYAYGGENINITAPKRDTGANKQAESDDEDFGIDVRFKDQ